MHTSDLPMIKTAQSVCEVPIFIVSYTQYIKSQEYQRTYPKFCSKKGETTTSSETKKGGVNNEEA